VPELLLASFVNLPMVPMAMELLMVPMTAQRCPMEVDYQLAMLMWMQQILLLALMSLL
jgi:hypothetical protein